MRNPLTHIIPVVAAGAVTASCLTFVGVTPVEAAPQIGAQTEQADSTTQLAIAPAMAKRLAKVDANVRALDEATLSTRDGTIVLRFPATGTDDHEPAVLHRGGFEVAKGRKGVRLTNLRLNLRDKTLTATVNGNPRRDIFRVEPGPTATDAARVQLNKLSSGLFNASFDTHRFRAGQRVGSVRLPEQLLGSSVSEAITITNLSRFPLHYVGTNTSGMGHLTSTPKAVLQPGDRDVVTYESNNAGGGEVDISYRIDGTELVIDGFFQVPILGFNESRCADNDYTVNDSCYIESTWHPQATWTINTNVKTAPIPDFGLGDHDWMLHPVGAPGSKKLQVNGSSKDDGGVVSLWDAGSSNTNAVWLWVPTSDGWGQLMNEASRKCLERNGTTGVVDQWTCAPSSTNQLWRPVLNPHGGSALQLQSTNEYLTFTADPGSVSNGTTLVLSDTLSNRNSWGGEELD